MATNGINLTDPIFHDDDAARAHLEAIRWPDGPTCPTAEPRHQTLPPTASATHRKSLTSATSAASTSR